MLRGSTEAKGKASRHSQPVEIESPVNLSRRQASIRCSQPMEIIEKKGAGK
jgi:hypothetical protein